MSAKALHVQADEQTSLGDDRKLVFDIGMNRGDDTKTYLSMGYHVVAVEANPMWFKKNKRVFQKEIVEGRLTILNSLLDEVTTASQPFWSLQIKPETYRVIQWLDKSNFLRNKQLMGSQVQGESGGSLTLLSHFDEFASISKDNACDLSIVGCDQQKNCTSFGNFGFCSESHPICSCERSLVRATTCADLIKDFGVPHYLKIDIEGFDGYCMRALANLPCDSLPAYISFEEQGTHMHRVASSEELISKLSDRGYVWKVSRQNVTQHWSMGSGPFGEDVDDFVRGRTWSDGKDAVKRANRHCWEPIDPEYGVTYDCDVHGRFTRSDCQELEPKL